MSKNTVGILYMVVATFGWGLSFLLNKNLLNALEMHTLITFRFIIGCSLLCAVFWKRLRQYTDRTTLLCGFIMGGLLYLDLYFTFLALETTDSGIAGVIMGSSIIWTQLLQTVVQRRLPSPWIAVAAILGFIGMTLLAWKGGHLQFSPGELLSLFTGFLSGIMVVAFNHMLRNNKLDATSLSIWECLWCGIIGFVGMFCFEQPDLQLAPADWVSLILLGVICSGVCFLCIGRAQACLDAGRVGILLALEPFFALLIGVLVAREHVALTGYLGCAFILTAAALAGKPDPIHNT